MTLTDVLLLLGPALVAIGLGFWIWQLALIWLGLYCIVAGVSLVRAEITRRPDSMAVPSSSSFQE